MSLLRVCEVPFVNVRAPSDPFVNVRASSDPFVNVRAPAVAGTVTTREQYRVTVIVSCVIKYKIIA